MYSNRRRFFSQFLQSLSAVVIVGGILGIKSRSAKGSLPPQYIRPPGAVDENEFLAACVRCGLCVRDCPFDTLGLIEFGETGTVGTPVFVARDVPCEMCEDIPCVQACPTGALDHSLTDIRQSDMGIAVFTGVDRCYSFTGLGQCRACYMACPVGDDAITMERLSANSRTVFMPTVHTDHCTGCGKCEKECITDEASIKVLPRSLARQDPSLRTVSVLDLAK